MTLTAGIPNGQNKQFEEKATFENGVCFKRNLISIFFRNSRPAGRLFAPDIAHA